MKTEEKKMVNAVFNYFYSPSYGRKALAKIPHLMKEKGVNPKLILGWGKPFYSDFSYLDQTIRYINGINLGPYDNSLEIILQKYMNLDIKVPNDLYDSLLVKFGRYCDLLSRYDANGQRYHDYLNLFNIYIRFFYAYLSTENIDIVYFSHFLHQGNDLVLYEIAKYLNIKTFFTHPIYEVETGKSLLLYTDTMDFDNLFYLMKKKLWNSEVHIPTSFKKDLAYMKNLHIPQIKDKKFKIHRLDAFRCILPFRQKFMNSNKFINRLYSRLFEYKKYKDSLSARNKYIQPADFSKKYVYFGLHLQPEATTSFFGGKYVDQLLAIERLAEMIPEDWKIYVKENPKQTDLYRGKSFYGRLHMIKKAVLVPLETDTYELMEHSQFVASITGTMLYEAVSGGKPALMFGHFWYDRLPGVFKYKPDLKVEDIINCQIDHDELQQKARDFYSLCLDASIWDHFSLDDENENKIVNLMLAYLHGIM